jgi:CBS domain-containing protein
MKTAADVMTKDLVTVFPETTVEELAKIFIEHRIGTVPVLNKSGELIGVVTETDLVERDRNLHMPTIISLFDWVIYLEDESRFRRELRKMTGQTVADLYTAEVMSVSPETSLDRVADIMADKHINAVPVTTGKKLVGIVSRIDLIRTLVKR